MTAEMDPRIVRRLADMNAVYRMFGHAGELLYVGKTGHLGRFDSHAMKRWFPLVSRITLEWHETEAAARVAERRAIQTERPRYNLADNPRRRRLKERVSEPAEPPADREVLIDVLRVFGEDSGLHWAVLAERLASKIPSRWADVTKEVVSAQCRALGVRSVTVRWPAGAGSHVNSRVLQGCRRSDVEVLASRRVANGSAAIRSRLRDPARPAQTA